MSEYSTIDPETGEYIHVYDMDKCLKAIRIRNQRNETIINQLEEELRKLLDEYSKDEEIQKMKQELETMKKDYYRGFPITEKEHDMINVWINEHELKAHGLVTEYMKLKAGGVSGGRYSYHFIPSAIGTSGTVRCSCGAEFEFQSFG